MRKEERNVMMKMTKKEEDRALKSNVVNNERE